MPARPSISSKPKASSDKVGPGQSRSALVGWLGLILLFGAAVALYALDLNRSDDNKNQSGTANPTNLNRDLNQSNANSTGESSPILTQPNIDLTNLTPPETTADLPQSENDCQTADGSWAWSDSQCLPQDQATCEQSGGIWGPVGQSIPEGCSLLTDDSGRLCQDSSECAGYCLLNNTGQNSTSRDDELANATGQCSSRTLIRGCYAEVTRGLAGVKCF